MEPIKIDKNVPMPPKPASRHIYPWDAMEVGDSFFAPDPKGELVRAQSYPEGKKRGVKFASRTVTENGVKGVRIWRVR